MGTVSPIPVIRRSWKGGSSLPRTNPRHLYSFITSQPVARVAVTWRSFSLQDMHRLCIPRVAGCRHGLISHRVLSCTQATSTCARSVCQRSIVKSQDASHPVLMVLASRWLGNNSVCQRSIVKTQDASLLVLTVLAFRWLGNDRTRGGHSRRLSRPLPDSPCPAA